MLMLCSPTGGSTPDCDGSAAQPWLAKMRTMRDEKRAFFARMQSQADVLVLPPAAAGPDDTNKQAPVPLPIATTGTAVVDDNGHNTHVKTAHISDPSLASSLSSGQHNTHGPARISGHTQDSSPVPAAPATRQRRKSSVTFADKPDIKSISRKSIERSDDANGSSRRKSVFGGDAGASLGVKSVGDEYDSGSNSDADDNRGKRTLHGSGPRKPEEVADNGDGGDDDDDDDDSMSDSERFADISLTERVSARLEDKHIRMMLQTYSTRNYLLAKEMRNRVDCVSESLVSDVAASTY